MMLLRIIKWFCGVALLPVAVLAGWVGLDLVRGLGALSVTSGMAPDVIGLVSGLFMAGLLFSLLPRPMRAYVLGHELTHAATALLSGARVRRIRVSRSGGSVQVSRTGIWIDLSPYIVPPATLLLLIARLLYGWFVAPGHAPFWLAAAGLTWGFHVCFTVSVLAQGQPDVAAHGRLFSFTLIATLNLAVGIGLLCLAAPALRGEVIPTMLARASDVWSLLARGGSVVLMRASPATQRSEVGSQRSVWPHDFAAKSDYSGYERTVDDYGRRLDFSSRNP